MKIVFFVFAFLCVGCSISSANLVLKHEVSGDDYFVQLAASCIDFHIGKKSNALDIDAKLPVKIIDSALVSTTFAYPYIDLKFFSSENITDYVTILSCTFDRLTGEVVGFASLNAHLSENNKIEYPPAYSMPKKYKEMIYSLGLSLHLDYENLVNRIVAEDSTRDFD